MSSIAAAAPSKGRLPPLRLTDGAVEALKWLALAAMVLDHANKYLWHDSVHLAFNLGRIAMPIFAVLLGFNLARGVPGAYRRTGWRLLWAGVVATVPFIALGGLGWGWWPLNIMATLLVATAVCGALATGRPLHVGLAAGVFVVGGSSVEFWWPGIALCVAAWSYARAPSWPALVMGLVSLAALRVVNGNDWALLAIPLIVAAAFWTRPVPRIRYVFYALYPAHLAALWWLQRQA